MLTPLAAEKGYLRNMQKAGECLQEGLPDLMEEYLIFALAFWSNM